MVQSDGRANQGSRGQGQKATGRFFKGVATHQWLSPWPQEEERVARGLANKEQSAHSQRENPAVAEPQIKVESWNPETPQEKPPVTPKNKGRFPF